MYKIFEISFLFLLLVINYLVVIRRYFGQNTEDSEHTLDVPSLIVANNYPSERHRVQTEDGYILELHRIPHGRFNISGTKTGPRPVVFMVHCILCTSSIWVMQGPQNGPGYILADAGYDVWMMNTRGNSYSSKHLNYSLSDSRFWEFSFHEKGIYDVPASIDYILSTTNQASIYYIGFSMGTTIYFAMASSRPEYNQKISKMVALAPAVFVTHAEGLIPDLSLHWKRIEESFKEHKGYKIPPVHWGLRSILGNVCDSSFSLLQPVCASVLNFLARVYVDQLELKKLSYYFRFFPDYTSLKTAVHYFQVKSSDVFRQYDYGLGNLVYYGSPTPPLYNIQSINTTIHLVYSTGDRIAVQEDVMRLFTELPEAYIHEIDSPLFSHAHFCWSKDVGNMTHRIINILKE